VAQSEASNADPRSSLLACAAPAARSISTVADL